MTQSTRSSRLRSSVLLTSVCALWAACGAPESGRDVPPRNEGDEPVGTNEVALVRVDSCEDVLGSIQESALARLRERAEQLRQAPEVYYGQPGVVVPPDVFPTEPGWSGGDPAVDLPEGAPAPSFPAAGGAGAGGTGGIADPPAQAPTPSVPSGDNASGGSSGSGGASSGSGFSGTTVQVREVDEADVVKTDGDNLYLLQGNTLVKLRAWPAAELQTLTSVPIEGQPREMFVRDGKAVVFSDVYREFATSDANPYSSYYGYYPSYGYAKVTVLDVSGDTIETLRETYLEGSYVSSRRHDGVVRLIMQAPYKAPALDSTYIEYFTPWGEPYRQEDIDAQVDAWLERIEWAVEQTELGDWLPRQYSAVDGAIVEQDPNCFDFYRPGVDPAQSGVTSVFTVDLDADDGTSALGGATVLARAERVYSNSNVILLTQTDYNAVVDPFVWGEHTTLHRFDLSGADTVYTASGTVPGYVQGQFSLDEYQDIVRVSTTENNWNAAPGEPTGPTNRVITLATENGSLNVLGQTDVFGQNETIFATRFIGPRGYVVTFRQTDPLFVVDLSEPAQPAVVGELHIPGFSNFLYPLGEDHLLAIGRDATLDGVTQGLALSIFDVSDPTAPTRPHTYVYGDYSSSDANIDHRAITFHPDQNRIAFPLWSGSTGLTSLEVFDVSTSTGFSSLGRVTPPELELPDCVVALGYGPEALDGWLGQEIAAYPEYRDQLLYQCRSIEQVRRGLFRDDYVYAITTLGVYAHEASALSEPPVGQASLPEQQYYYYPEYGWGGSSMGGFGGGVWVGGAAGSAGAAGAAGSGFGGQAGSAFVGEAGSSFAGAAGSAMATPGAGATAGSASAGAAGSN